MGSSRSDHSLGLRPIYYMLAKTVTVPFDSSLPLLFEPYDWILKDLSSSSSPEVYTNSIVRLIFYST